MSTPQPAQFLKLQPHSQDKDLPVMALEYFTRIKKHIPALNALVVQINKSGRIIYDTWDEQNVSHGIAVTISPRLLIHTPCQTLLTHSNPDLESPIPSKPTLTQTRPHRTHPFQTHQDTPDPPKRLTLPRHHSHHSDPKHTHAHTDPHSTLPDISRYSHAARQPTHTIHTGTLTKGVMRASHTHTMTPAYIDRLRAPNFRLPGAGSASLSHPIHHGGRFQG